MWNIYWKLCLVLLICCTQFAYTSFISDKTLRETANCVKTCDDFCSFPRKCSENGLCGCSRGYSFDQSCECVRCEYLRNECTESCCNGFCIDNICMHQVPKPDPSQDIFLTATQIAMTAALILGIITIIALLWKMCSKTDYRRRPRPRSAGQQVGASMRSENSNTSGGSLQRTVNARLRDAPPPYIRSPPLPPPGDTPPPYHLVPSQGYVNASFESEGNIPPPEYSVAVTVADDDASADSNHISTVANESDQRQEVKSDGEKETTTDNNTEKTAETVSPETSIHI